MKQSQCYLLLLVLLPFSLVKANTGDVELLPGYGLKYSLATTASRERIWQLWSRVDQWRQFDERLELSYLEEGHTFSLGASGYIKAYDGPKTRFTITEFEDGHSFVETLYLPLYQSIELSRYFETNASGQLIFVHEVKFKGRLRSVFYWVLCRAFKKDLKKVMGELKRIAEQDN